LDTPCEELKIDPFKILIGHTWYELGLIMKVINDYDCRAFLEIGIHVGGLAACMAMYGVIDPGFRYLGIELSEVHTNVNLKNFIASRANSAMMFCDAYTDKAVTVAKQWLSGCDRPAFIYADGGNKVDDLRMYSPIARLGDIVAVHDYGTYERAEISPGDAFSIMTDPPFAIFTPGLWGGTRIFAWRKTL